MPLFLILSLFLSYRKYQEIYSIDLRELQCPVCKNHLNGSQVGLKESDLSIRMPCESCRKSMTFIIEQS